jgi:transposase
MSKPGKNNVAYSGFVIPETGELFVMKPGWFNYETVIQSFRDFIKSKPLEEGKKYCIILDNAPWHKKAIRLIWGEEQPEYSDIREAMTYLSLPPYSPDLNPIEQVWRVTRREKTHNRYFGSLSKITEVLDDYFDGFSMPNDQLRSLCKFSCFHVA